MKPFVVHLICSSGFYGAERVVANLCQEMKGADVSVLCLTPSNKSIAKFQLQVEESDTEWISIDNSISKSIKILLRLNRCHDNLVLHVHGYKEIVIACLFKLISDCGVIVTQHGFTERNLKSRCYNWIDMALCRWANIKNVLCVSADIYCRYRDFGVPLSRLVSLPNGVLIPGDLEENSIRDAIAKQLNISLDTRIILYAGRLSEEKDPLLFLETIKILMKSSQKIVAVIVGEGPLLGRVCQEMNLFTSNECVKIMGFVGNIEEFLVAADILLLTSKTEGTPMIVLEAMIQKCAVVATDVGGISDIITHEKNGFLVRDRTSDKLSSYCERLLENPVERNEITAAAKLEVVEKFSLCNQMPDYRRRYKECLE